jgi:hypothetical protein
LKIDHPYRLKIDQGKLLHSVLYSIENMTFVNTLRIALRSGGKLSETDWQFFAQFLPDTEIIELKSDRNVATQLLQKQVKVLGALIGKDWGRTTSPAGTVARSAGSSYARRKDRHHLFMT